MTTDLPLIRTKLAPPRAGKWPISRDALVRQLDERRDRKLSLVLGPAGCGKTTLLTQWRKKLFLQGAKVAWYNAASDDDDAVVASYIVESLTQAGVPIEGDALHLFVRSSGKVWKPLLAALVNDTARLEGDIYLVIDDFHAITSFAILQLIDRWLSLAPAGFHLVLGSRIRPPLALTRLQAEDQISELRFGELRFGLDETRRFVEAQGLAHLNAAQVRALHDITDGWAAGLQLLAFSLRKEAAPAALIERQDKLSLSQEAALDDYLERTIGDQLSEEELGFLTRVSACRRFNRELCEMLTGNPSAAELLAKFENENLFVIPIDTSDSEPWYRFHRLFATFLHGRLRKLDEAEIRKLHQLASHWFAGKGLHVEAMRHALLAGDADFAVELIDRSARRMINSANFVQFLKWCDAVPRERLRMRLNVSLCAAWAQLSCSRLAEFDRTIADIEQHPSHRKAEVRTEVNLLKAYRAMRQDDTAATLAIVQPMLRALPANPFHALILCHIASLSLVYANEFERARDVARLRHRIEIPPRPDYPPPLVDVMEGFSHLVQGNIRLAVASLTPYIDAAIRSTAHGGDSVGHFLGYLVEAYDQSGEAAAARDLLDRYSDLIEAAGVADGLLFAHRVRARLQADNVEGARATLKRLEEIGYRLNLDRLVAWSLYEQIALALRSRQSAYVSALMPQLEELAARYRGQRHCAWGEIPLATALARADVAFDRKDPSCLVEIDAAIAIAEMSRRQLLVARLGFMRAMMLLRDGDREAASKTAAVPLRMASEFGMARLLLDFGAIAQPLTRALLEQVQSSSEREYLERALRAGGISPMVAAKESTASGILSAREREVLDLLSKALSVKSIARALDLSPGTAKWHVKNIYGKLNATSREDALAKARALHILQ